MLHQNNILHRDLKSANIFLLSDGTVKIGDMNVSKIAKKGLLYTQTGTPFYASPEVWNDKPYDSKSDIWSAGCILYELTTLRPPFRSASMEGLYKRVIRGNPKKIPSHYSVDLNTLIQKMLQVSPVARPSAAEILQFPFMEQKMRNNLFQSEAGIQNEMLKTIKYPQNLRNLTSKLPMENYTPIRTREFTSSCLFSRSMMPGLPSSPKKLISLSQNKVRRKKLVSSSLDRPIKSKIAGSNKLELIMEDRARNLQKEAERLKSKIDNLLKKQRQKKESIDYRLFQVKGKKIDKRPKQTKIEPLR